MLKDSFNRAYEYLRKNIGLDPLKWHWGKIHQITFEHSMSIQEPMDKVFNKGPFPIGGDTDTPCQMAITPNEPFHAKSYVPTWRQIIDLSDWSKSQYNFAPGQSGQVSSTHYDDLIQNWLIGVYDNLLWTRGQIEGNLTNSLDLGI